ncbi:uncharacterized protein LOC116738692 [Nasonia vitripennis]|uniref:BEN domain-containing protein n=1 Tax=Nasonia vitripennis TaxID=7425 RepID=A0A7M7R4H4_NASVI|nr:uncharacterized protein LOC116738692 [Nasonia vitripennis]
MADYNKELMKKSSIFNDDSEAEESDQASKYKDGDDNDNVPETSNHDKDRRKLQDEITCVCANIPLVSKEDLDKLDQVLSLTRAIHAVRTKLPEVTLQENHDVAGQNEIKNESSIEMDTDVELIKGSGIIVNAWKLRSIKNTYSKNPKEMARKLMKMIIGVEQLKKSSPTGKNGRIPIPTDVFEGVEPFYALYRETMTAMCATLRNPKPKAEDMKKIINIEREEVKPDEKNNKEEATASKEQDDFEQDLEELSDGDFEKDLEELSDGDFEKESDEIKKNKETKNDEKIEYDEKSEEKKKQKRPRKTHPPETLQTTNSTRVMREKNPKRPISSSPETNKGIFEIIESKILFDLRVLIVNLSTQQSVRSTDLSRMGE